MKAAALVPDIACLVFIGKKKIKLAQKQHLSSRISAAI